MSDTGNTPPTPEVPQVPPSPGAPPPPPQRNVWLTVFMVLVGIVLLLPGVCALGFGFIAITNPRGGGDFGGFILVGLLVGFGGVMLIRAAIRGRRR